MQQNLHQTGHHFIDPAYKHLPSAFLWTVNATGRICLGLPYAMVLIPCLAAVWGASLIQTALASAGFGIASAVMTLIKTGIGIIGFELLIFFCAIRDETEARVHALVRDACEGFQRDWKR